MSKLGHHFVSGRVEMRRGVRVVIIRHLCLSAGVRNWLWLDLNFAATVQVNSGPYCGVRWPHFEVIFGRLRRSYLGEVGYGAAAVGDSGEAREGCGEESGLDRCMGAELTLFALRPVHGLSRITLDMTRSLHLGLLLVVLGLASCGQPSEAGHEGAAGERLWMPSDLVPLGETMVGKTFYGKIPLQNPQLRSHKILEVKGSCVCQDIRLESEGQARKASGILTHPLVVAPGGSVVLEFALMVGLGPHDVSFSIQTDDPENREFSVRARYVGIPLFELNGDADGAGIVSLPPMAVGRTQSFHVRVRRHDGKPFRLLDVPEGLPDHVVMAWKAQEDGSTWSVTGQIVPALASMSSLGGRLSIRTDAGEPLRLSVIAPVQKLIERTPDRLLSFGIVRKEKGSTRTWTLRLTREGSLSPHRILIEGRKGARHVLDCEWELREHGAVVVIRGRVVPGSIRGKFSGRIVVEFLSTDSLPRTQSIRYSGFLM